MTDSLLPANIFFITATIAIIVVTVLSIIASVYLIKILRDMQHASRIAKDQTEKIMQEIEECRADFHDKKAALLGIADILMRFLPKKLTRRE